MEITPHTFVAGCSFFLLYLTNTPVTVRADQGLETMDFKVPSGDDMIDVEASNEVLNSSYLGTAMGHVTSCGCTGVWSVEKLVPMIFGLVNRGKICGHSMCSLPAVLFYPPFPSPPGPVWAVRGLCLIKKPVNVASKTRTKG